MRRMILVSVMFLLLSFVRNNAQIALAQSQAVQSRIVLEEKFGDAIRVVNWDTKIHVDIPADNCRNFSPDFHYVAMAKYDDEAFLKVYNLDTGDLVIDMPYAENWINFCYLNWYSETVLAIPNEPVKEVAQATKVHIDMLTGTVSDSLPLPEFRGFLTNRDPLSIIVRPSPDRSHYVYTRCDQPYSSAHGCPGSGEVIFDVAAQQVVVKLKNTSPTPPEAAFPEFKYSWSSDGRYLAYERTVSGLNVFDLQTKEYLDTDFLDQASLLMYHNQFGIKWSPDETQLIVFSNLLNPKTYDVLFGMSLINLQTHSVMNQVVDETQRPIGVEQFAWLPDGQHILVVHDNLQMVRIDVNTLDQAGEVVAENVERIWSWYSPG